MTDVLETIKVLKDLGILQFFTIPLGFLVFLFLFKKLIFNGSGKTLEKIGVFIRQMVVEFLANEKERIKNQTGIDNKLTDLCQKFDQIVEGFFDTRRLFDERIRYFENALRDHVVETRNLLLILKEKTDQMPEEGANLINPQYLKQEPVNS